MEQNIQTQIDDINRKLDVIVEEIELQRANRREMEDLKDDLMRIGKDVYDTAVVELEEMHDQLSSQDVVHLGKKLLRNVNNLTQTFEQLESAKDFLNDFAPLSREMVIDFMKRLDEFDRKGYFEFAKELTGAMDNIVSSFTIDDVKSLADNVVTILSTVKNLTQPDMLHAVNNAVSIYKNIDTHVEKDVSYFKLMKELSTPEMKRGLAVGIQFLKNLAESTNGNGKKQIK